MVGNIVRLRVLAICVGLVLALAACSSTSQTGLETGQRKPAVPGSQKDFSLNVGDRVLFPTDVTNLTEEAKETLRRQAAWLKLYPAVRVRVEGHADERGTREYNIALSARRAATTKAFLIAQGVSPSRLDTISYGKERPVALCDADSCWRQNRRAVTAVVSGAVSG